MYFCYDGKANLWNSSSHPEATVKDIATESANTTRLDPSRARKCGCLDPQAIVVCIYIVGSVLHPIRDVGMIFLPGEFIVILA